MLAELWKIADSIEFVESGVERHRYLFSLDLKVNFRILIDIQDGEKP